MSDQTRNLNPHAAARVAMVFYGKRYADYGGGSMDFWDSLAPNEKAFCATIARQVRLARPYTGSY